MNRGEAPPRPSPQGRGRPHLTSPQGEEFRDSAGVLWGWRSRGQEAVERQLREIGQTLFEGVLGDNAIP